MALVWIISGLMCNALECYWVVDTNQAMFSSERECIMQADILKQNTMMYFETKCVVFGDRHR